MFIWVYIFHPGVNCLPRTQGLLCRRTTPWYYYPIISGIRKYWIIPHNMATCKCTSHRFVRNHPIIQPYQGRIRRHTTPWVYHVDGKPTSHVREQIHHRYKNVPYKQGLSSSVSHGTHVRVTFVNYYYYILLLLSSFRWFSFQRQFITHFLGIEGTVDENVTNVRPRNEIVRHSIQL